jgi:hypothetical protein
MSTLNGLKLVVSKKQLHASPIVIRRNKLISKLHEQIELCEAQREGKTYAPIRLKTFVNKTSGERMTAEVPKRVKEWFWVSNESNKINLCVKYGAKTLALTKDGKNAIEVNDKKELVNTLKAIKEAVLNGELDTAISSISDTTKRGFKK